MSLSTSHAREVAVCNGTMNVVTQEQTTSAPQPRQDQHVVERVLGGDAEVYRVLVQRYQAPLNAYSFAMTGDPTTAHEAVGEAFVLAFKALTRIPDRSDFFSFVLRALGRQLKNRVRAPQRAGTVSPERRRDFLAALEGGEVTSSAVEGAHDLALRLPVEQREAWALQYVAQIPFDVAEAAMIASTDVLEWRLAEAQKRMEQLAGEPEPGAAEPSAQPDEDESPPGLFLEE